MDDKQNKHESKKMDDKPVLPEFNLLEEPWILVLNTDGQTETVSMLEVFERAHSLSCLAGELPTQDIAILRLLLAVLHAVFTRNNEINEDAPNEDAPIENYDEAIQRWKTLWEMKKFPTVPIQEYFKKYRDRFYLFHPEYPFWQVPNLKKGTPYDAPKLFGDISESGNKVRLFQHRSGQSKERLNEAEAIRWLIHINAFDDQSAKATRNEDHLPVGVGWLGQLGVVYASGDTLFETLMLNFVLLTEDGDTWKGGSPVWKLPVKADERTKIDLPQSQMSLLTLQSRRIFLQRDRLGITSYMLLGGDFFNKENAFIEQMTKWKKVEKGKGTQPAYLPKPHNTSKQLWRDFASLLRGMDSSRPPGIISWLERLKSERFLKNKLINIQATSIKYGGGTQMSSVDDVWGDSLSVNAGFLSKCAQSFVSDITNLLKKTDDGVKALGVFAKDLLMAVGVKYVAEGKNKIEKLKSVSMERAYFNLDIPFRGWLLDIDPDMSNMHTESERWKKESERWKKIVHNTVTALAQEMVEEAGPKAFVGREDKKLGLITASSAHLKFFKAVKDALKQ